MPQIAVGSVPYRRLIETEHVVPGDHLGFTRGDWLPAGAEFGLAAEREQHRALLDAVQQARARLQALPAELRQAEAARIDALANGDAKAPRPDPARLESEAREVLLAAQIGLVAYREADGPQVQKKIGAA
jgi:hypothetical protein